MCRRGTGSPGIAAVNAAGMLRSGGPDVRPRCSRIPSRGGSRTGRFGVALWCGMRCGEPLGVPRIRKHRLDGHEAATELRRPSEESMRARSRVVCVSRGAGASPATRTRKTATLRAGVVSGVRWCCSIFVAAASSSSAWRAKSARGPLRCFEALRGSFTPSIANISRPTSLCWSDSARTAAKTRAISSPGCR